MKNKQTPLSYLVRVVTTDGLVFTSKIILCAYTWVILHFITKEIVPCVSVRILQETDGTFSLGHRGECNE